MKEKTCCFTGHREIPSEQYQKIFEKTERAVEEHIKNGYLYFSAGGALGFDTLAAIIVLDLKKKYPQIALNLVLPCPTQAKSWSEKDKKIYEDIKQKADNITYTSLEYSRGCMHKRNRCLVDNSSACICYLTEDNGGTFYTVKYAKKHGLTVINISDTV